MIPYGFIAVGAFWCFISWILFARTFKNTPIAWVSPMCYGVSIPFLVLALLYTYFSFYEVPIDLRSIWVRGTLAMVVYTIAPILTLISILAILDNRKRDNDDT